MNTDIRNLSKWLNEEQEAPIDRQALARVLAMAEQPAQQEPVAWMKSNATEWSISFFKEDGYVPLYTSPPAQRTWVGLTEAERKKIEKRHIFVEDAIRLTEAKLKEKNT